MHLSKRVNEINKIIATLDADDEDDRDYYFELHQELFYIVELFFNAENDDIWESI